MKTLYRAFGYLGLMSIFGSMLYGFRYAHAAPPRNVLLDAALYAGFALPHLVMTRGWFKSSVWGPRRGSALERQVYIIVTNVTWFVIYAVHFPVGGPSLVVPGWVSFVGTLAFLWAAVAFFEGLTFEMLDGMLAVPGRAMQYSQGGETPLFTGGKYARVRHPMYQAAFLAGLASLVIHPNAAQLLWVVMTCGTFLAFIPVEESDMISARGQAYADYRKQTPYRLFQGVW